MNTNKKPLQVVRITRHSTDGGTSPPPLRGRKSSVLSTVRVFNRALHPARCPKERAKHCLLDVTFSSKTTDITLQAHILSILRTVLLVRDTAAWHLIHFDRGLCTFHVRSCVHF